MPVKFYPEKPLELLERYITKENGNPLQGEIDVYRRLFNDLDKDEKEWHVWHDLKLPIHSETANPKRKTSAQIDFLVLSKLGVLILEVKGGPISFKNNSFYYGNNFETQIKLNPFTQAEGYKFTIKDFVLNSNLNHLVCHGVVLPHCTVNLESKITESKVLWTSYNSSNYNDSILEFIESIFHYNRAKHAKYHRTFETLSSKELNNTIRLLSPIINDTNKYYNSDTSEWLNIQNLEILSSLLKNQRIMIEGPPGSGKTTFAKAYIDNQSTKQGLYLCWNNLLMHKVTAEFKERGLLSNCKVTTLVRFILDIDPSQKSEHLIKLDVNDFYNEVKKTIEKLKKDGSLKLFDFIVIDEGQDILDRGADLVINEFLANGNGLSNGRLLFLYDIDQSYYGKGQEISEIADLLSVYFAHFRLNDVKRSAQSPEIRKLSQLLLGEPEEAFHNISKGINLPELSSQSFLNLSLLKDHLVKTNLNSIRDQASSLKGKNTVLLVESSLMQEIYKSDPGLLFYLKIKDIEPLTDKNIVDKGNILRYTSILKYKGLEKENVILVVQSPSQNNIYELYVGITRAITNLEILILDD